MLPGGRLGLERAGAWRAAIAGITPAPEHESSPAAQVLRRRMDARLHAPAAYPIPRPDLSDWTIPLAPDGPGRQGRVGRLVAILWQGLRRHAQTTAAAARGVLPKALEQVSADIAIDFEGRALFARRDPLGRIVGIELSNTDRSKTRTKVTEGLPGLTTEREREIPSRLNRTTTRQRPFLPRSRGSHER